MRIAIAALLLAIGCATVEPVGPTEDEIEARRDTQRWDAFCRNPPTDGDWREWCARRTQQRQLEVTQELLQTQQDEHAAANNERARAERQRQFERQQAIWKASQAPWQQQN